MEKTLNKLYANIGKLITSSLEIEDILQGIMEEVRIFFNPENWSLLRLDPTTDELFFLIFKGKIEQSKIKDIRLKIGEGIAGEVAKTGKALFVSDTKNESHFSRKVDKLSGFETKSIIAVPMRCRDKIFGVIEIVNSTTGLHFTPEEYLVLQTIADFSAIAFANCMMFEQVKELSYVDPLTGLYNRAKLDFMVKLYKKEALQNRSQDYQRIITVVAIDLNDFKLVNDKKGHLAGDGVLKNVSRMLSRTIRKTDMVFRYGGDEFLIIMESNEESGIKQAEERVLSELREISQNGEISFSFGHASGRADQLEDIMHSADKNMYKIKKQLK